MITQQSKLINEDNAYNLKEIKRENGVLNDPVPFVVLRPVAVSRVIFRIST